MTAMVSSCFTRSPSDFSHSLIWTSVMDSPTAGIFSSMGHNYFFFDFSNGEFLSPAFSGGVSDFLTAENGFGVRLGIAKGTRDELRLLQLVRVRGARGRARGLNAADGRERKPVENFPSKFFHADNATRPCSRVLPGPKTPACFPRKRLTLYPKARRAADKAVPGE